MIQAAGTDVAPGFLLARTLAKTILDTGSGNGTFLGTAVYVGGEEVVLVSELEAGWYRYVSEWRLHAYGTPGPLRRRRRLSMIRLRVTSPIATAET
jgi:hypothetical protein